MQAFVASVVILLISWEAVFATGTCPSACCGMINRVSDRVQGLEDASPNTPPPPENEWELVFSAKEGSGKHVGDSWLAAADVSPDDPTADLFKSPLVEEWGKRPVDQVRIEVTNGTMVKAYFIFDGRRTTKADFMSQESLMASSYGRLEGAENFGINVGDGHNFYILEESEPGCQNIRGWISVSDKTDGTACTWMGRASKPFFVYCEGDEACDPNEAPMADTFRILFKFA